MDITITSCSTTKKINYPLSNTLVEKIIRGMTVYYRVPCILLPYKDELQLYLTQTDISTAITTISMQYLQYNILQKPVRHVRRYKYPFIPTTSQTKLIYYRFVLYESATTEAVTYASSIPSGTYNFMLDTDDAKYIKSINSNFTESIEISSLLTKCDAPEFPLFVISNYTTISTFPQFGLIDRITDRFFYIPGRFLKTSALYRTYPINSTVSFKIIDLPSDFTNIYSFFKM
jgi:hypothetical protein